ncbi:hypothetical protein [Salegentibacter sediminis]|uniref:hypothetical protein n=1 Tax=Salegentibacter sediminis TaxID=1930251 RepID=UPI0009C0C63F|nr:hypothetical protein [Salegentibacter sediminis]
MLKRTHNPRHPELDSGSHLSKQPGTSEPKTENYQDEIPGQARNDDSRKAAEPKPHTPQPTTHN